MSWERVCEFLDDSSSSALPSSNDHYVGNIITNKIFIYRITLQTFFLLVSFPFSFQVFSPSLHVSVWSVHDQISHKLVFCAEVWRFRHIEILTKFKIRKFCKYFAGRSEVWLHYKFASFHLASELKLLRLRKQLRVYHCYFIFKLR